MGLAPMMALLASFVGSAFAVARLAMASGREATDRLCDVIESALARQSAAMERLAGDVGESAGLLARLAARGDER